MQIKFGIKENQVVMTKFKLKTDYTQGVEHLEGQNSQYHVDLFS